MHRTALRSDRRNGSEARLPRQRETYAADGLNGYLQQIGRVPLLTPDEEVRLAHSAEVGVLAAERLADGSGATPEDRRDLQYLAEEGARAKRHLVRANLRLVVSIARRYAGRGVVLLDLVQEGNVGLIRAVERFDYRLGFKFSTYATWWIRQAVSQSAADQSRAVRVPVHVLESVGAVVRRQQELTQALHRSPTLAELAAEMEMRAEKVAALLRLTERPVSLDTPMGSGSLAELLDLAANGDGVTPDGVERRWLHEEVVELLHPLTRREEQVVRLRYGIGCARPHSLVEIGQVLGVTRERARQIEARALVRMRRLQGVELLREYL